MWSLNAHCLLNAIKYLTLCWRATHSHLKSRVQNFWNYCFPKSCSSVSLLTQWPLNDRLYLSIVSDGFMIFICWKHTVVGHLGLVTIIYACSSRGWKERQLHKDNTDMRRAFAEQTNSSTSRKTAKADVKNLRVTYLREWCVCTDAYMYLLMFLI